jgi:hypothetical protein
MRALAGPALLLVVVGGFGLYRYTAAPKSPPREFLDLEFAGADDTGSCYSLSTVIVANMIFNSSLMEWRPDGEDTWILSLEDVQNDGGGPSHVFQHYTFRADDDLAHLVYIEASKGQDTDVVTNIDSLLEAPNGRRSTPMDRCREEGAEGYHFRERK